jgi:hypothetical protein
MTNAQYLAWLADPTAIFTFLVEATVGVNGSDATIYLSNSEYRTGPSDTPANVNYNPIANIGVLFTEQLSLDSNDASIGAGQLEIDNTDGTLDAWLNPAIYVWANRPIKVYIGDVRWPRTDFQTAFVGVVSDIAPSGRQKLVLKLRDKLQQLNTPISDITMSNGTKYKDDLIPLPFGEVHNITPAPEDSAALKYRVGRGQIESVIEVRDNGVPLTGASAPTIDLTVGRITLNATPAGTITASVQGDKLGGTYYYTCASIIKQIVKNYGDSTKRFTDADIDLSNFATFDAAHLQPMGIWCSDRTNVLEVCQALAGSIGAQMYVNSKGQLSLIQLATVQSGTPIVVTQADMVAHSLTPTTRTAAVASVKLGYCKNWTVQDTLLSGIPQAHKDLYAKEWLTSVKTDATIQASYKLSAQPTQQDTMLLTGADADVEAQRLLDLWKMPRVVYEFEGLPQLFTLELGQRITVYNSRYGMSAGVNGTIVSLTRNWSNRRIKVGFLV